MQNPLFSDLEKAVQHKVSMRRWGLAALLACLASTTMAQDELLEESQNAQQAQAKLQSQIDEADQKTRERVEALREAQRETRRLDAYNDELEPLVERQTETIASRERALETLSETRDALPVVLRELVRRLGAHVERDLPFLRDERLTRVASLESMLSDSEISTADKLDRVLSAWRAELDYGREMDVWSGRLEGEAPREADFLRIGRVGFYYLTPDGRQGGVWRAPRGEWQSLEGNDLAELRKGVRIARDQRAPEMLALPVSQEVEAIEFHEEDS